MNGRSFIYILLDANVLERGSSRPETLQSEIIHLLSWTAINHRHTLSSATSTINQIIKKLGL